MKKLITCISLIISTITFGQTITDTVMIASQKLSIPSNCKMKGENKIQCENYTLEWTYGDEQKVNNLQDVFLEMGNLLTGFKKKRVEFYLFETKMKGYKVSYNNASGKTFQLSVSGVINKMPVWVLVDLDKEPITNDDLPQFVKQVIRFSESKK